MAQGKLEKAKIDATVKEIEAQKEQSWLGCQEGPFQKKPSSASYSSGTLLLHAILSTN